MLKLYLHSVNPKQVNTLDIEQVKKILHAVPTHILRWFVFK
jgi:hypothetical protein